MRGASTRSLSTYATADWYVFVIDVEVCASLGSGPEPGGFTFVLLLVRRASCLCFYCLIHLLPLHQKFSLNLFVAMR